MKKHLGFIHYFSTEFKDFHILLLDLRKLLFRDF